MAKSYSQVARPSQQQLLRALAVFGATALQHAPPTFASRGIVQRGNVNQ